MAIRPSQFTPKTDQSWGTQHHKSVKAETYEAESFGLRPRPEHKVRYGKVSIRTGANVTRARTRRAKIGRAWSKVKSFLQGVTGLKRFFGAGNARRKAERIRHAGYTLDKGVNRMIAGIANKTIHTGPQLNKAVYDMIPSMNTLADNGVDVLGRVYRNMAESLRVVEKEFGRPAARKVVNFLAAQGQLAGQVNENVRNSTQKLVHMFGQLQAQSETADTIMTQDLSDREMGRDWWNGKPLINVKRPQDFLKNVLPPDKRQYRVNYDVQSIASSDTDASDLGKDDIKDDIIEVPLSNHPKDTVDLGHVDSGAPPKAGWFHEKYARYPSSDDDTGNDTDASYDSSEEFYDKPLPGGKNYLRPTAGKNNPGEVTLGEDDVDDMSDDMAEMYVKPSAEEMDNLNETPGEGEDGDMIVNPSINDDNSSAIGKDDIETIYPDTDDENDGNIGGMDEMLAMLKREEDVDNDADTDDDDFDTIDDKDNTNQ